MTITSLGKRYCICAAIFLGMLSVGRVHADPNVEKTIRDFFTAMTARDAASLKRVLGEKVAVIGAGSLRATVGFDETMNGRGLLAPERNGLDKMEVSAVKVDVSPTHRSVAVASFTLNIRLSKRQLADAAAELKQKPSNAEYLRKLIADGGIKASMFAMLAGNQDGTWKIVCVSLPS